MNQTPARIISPPAKPYRRCGSDALFERRFEPLEGPTPECYLWEPWQMPASLDCREWWTVLDCDGKLLLCAGLHFVNRFAYIRCRNLWGGEAHQHPEYRF